MDSGDIIRDISTTLKRKRDEMEDDTPIRLSPPKKTDLSQTGAPEKVTAHPPVAPQVVSER